MTTCRSVRLFMEHPLTAYVFTAGDRAWVGLADCPDSRPKSWTRIWSSHSPAVDADVGHLLRQLTETLELREQRDVSGDVRTIVAGHNFFDGWEYWGPGNPAPLLPRTAGDFVREAGASSLDEMTRRQPPGGDG
ncbi:hypothetical protein FH609_023800 [Streptomyces sp. 3MP-14]|uniref:Uncharacterized protein n=1 Tax=Streptomyces mimosae TaxID=2586635 RepID=A0A5N6ADW6_9ACTN|nr:MULTISPECIES: hypothetical protein [Streptomyces]KAB8166382.1 hypothetical protein FH607_011160 [Streptomyces mimosae]KAB8174175.1 hypothetical protein FH609_023800 [Streptomyces sp. 3MP-14]